jgi:hypothetical protein
MKKGQPEFCLVLACFIIALVIGGFSFIGFNNQETVICSVDSKERVTTGTNHLSSKFMVYCNEEVFQNTDELFAWKFNSADFQKNLKVGNKYQLLVCGFRIPFLSMFRNIIRIENPLVN